MKSKTDVNTEGVGGHAFREYAATSEYSGGGGGGGMDDILRRLDKLESQLESKVSKSDLEILDMKLQLNSANQTADLKSFISTELAKLPTEDRVKSIIDDKAKALDLATKTYVKEKTTSLHNKLILWIIGSGITISGLAITTYRVLFK
ncbi:hypothetical protein [Paenibacillus medicaginis]|uniref:Uncharacterized protein n=1 Tax=Paenibacillus medicaginis TaxID=1470560 RepID=A0ABV5BY46_9BACL